MPDDELVKLDGLDKAILGVCQIHCQEPRLIYDWDRCIVVLVETNGWTYDEAVEWMDHNVTCLYTGNTTPAFLYKYDEEEYK
jgi:hypothetical protein